MTILAIDFGGTQVKSALISDSFDLLESYDPVDSPKDLEQAKDLLERIISPVLDAISGLAISVPGTVDTQEGIIYHGGLLGFFHEFKIKQALEERYQKPVAVLNDGKAAVLAELATGNLRGVTNGAALVLGSGLGGGLIINGQLYQGSHYQSGELTFLLPDQAQKQTPDGLRGIHLSAVGLVKKINQVLGHADIADGRQAFKALEAKNPDVYPLFESYCRTAALTILNLQTTLDMERFVIGGGISAQPLLVEEINRQFDRLHQEIDFIGQIIKRPQILACQHQNGANLIGAAYFLREQQKVS